MHVHTIGMLYILAIQSIYLEMHVQSNWLIADVYEH